MDDEDALSVRRKSRRGRERARRSRSAPQASRGTLSA